jgi:hypothetical protein
MVIDGSKGLVDEQDPCLAYFNNSRTRPKNKALSESPKEPSMFAGGPRRDRTDDLTIKSRLLYQLS